MGEKDKQYGRLKFANRQNIEFDWSLEDKQPLVDDNVGEPEALYPAIPTETPGILMEANIVTPVTEPESETRRTNRLMESRASDAARNANFGPREADVLYRAQCIMGQRDAPRDVVIDVDIVPTEKEEIKESEETREEEEDEAPAGGVN